MIKEKKKKKFEKNKKECFWCHFYLCFNYYNLFKKIIKERFNQIVPMRNLN